MMDAEVSSQYLTQTTGNSSSNWFRDVVDSAAQLGTAYLNRQAAVAEANAQMRLAEARAAAGPGQSQGAPSSQGTGTGTGTDWNKIALIGGAVAVGIAVLYIVAKKA